MIMLSGKLLDEECQRPRLQSFHFSLFTNSYKNVQSKLFPALMGKYTQGWKMGIPGIYNMW